MHPSLTATEPSVQRKPAGAPFSGYLDYHPPCVCPGGLFPETYHTELILEAGVRVCVQLHRVAS